jgi:beta-glucanase (GH16 family)
MHGRPRTHARRVLLAAAVTALAANQGVRATDTKQIVTRSGLRPWVDPDTPEAARTVTSSRGDTWELVMSDEFNVAGRNFSAGKDHLWTALDMPDGVNSALEYYSPNMSSTVTESDGRGVFQIEIREEENITYTVYNSWTRPPSFETHSMYYRSAMVQTWNKFCFQGGRMEVLAQLPGAVSAASGNPDLGDSKARVENIDYYPTWPGIWLLGNLGRALFTGTTSRMWPWTYNECNEEMSTFQRISACNDTPGHGLNPNQGRGAPEIDLLEGGGTDISTSIQVAPGMADKFRIFEPTNDTSIYCIYGGNCDTEGANYPGVPTDFYEKRGHNSWYQGLRYAPNTICTPESDLIQSFSAVNRSVSQGIESNTCEGVNTCPASYDGYSSLGLIDGKGSRHWGINDVGGCMPKLNAYTGAYLCDPDNQHEKCSSPRLGNETKTNTMVPFNYQMDAISANSPIPLMAYTGYVAYQLEWVMGSSGYIRWMVEDIPIFEITAESIESPPQDSTKTNPRKLMIEEPMYIILNVALSTSWGSKPPNPGLPCRGDGTDAKTNKICDEFPMYMKLDYIRVYQDTSSTSNMSVGCDPASHPTAQFIEDHIDEYSTYDNPWIEVHGGARCDTDDDCTVGFSTVLTGQCSSGKCKCLSSGSWGGPRCTLALTSTDSAEGFGPPIAVAGVVAAVVAVILAFAVMRIIQARNSKKVLVATNDPSMMPSSKASMVVSEDGNMSMVLGPEDKVV